MRHTRELFFALIVLFFFALPAHASEIVLKRSGSGTLGVGQKFSVSIDIATGETPINAAQAVITFPKNILQATDVSLSGSVFRFWVELPEVSNDDGTIRFIGGTSQGISGGSAHLLTVEFQTKGIGAGEISASDVVITASDGKGTNVFTGVQAAQVQVGSQIVPDVPVGESGPPSAFVETPKPVTRMPVASAKLPAEPKLRVSLYPKAEEWYNYQGELTVLWDVPEDVTNIAADIDQNPNTTPKTVEKDLFTGKMFEVLDEGIHYIHVQFRNNVGWGKVTHHRVAIDITPPLAFKVKIDNAKSDNPTPNIALDTQDSLSGLSHAIIFVDGREIMRSTTTIATLSPQPPGTHTLLVRVFDAAGNTSEDSIPFEIIPLDKPVVKFVTKSASQEETISVSGQAVKDGYVDVIMYNDKGKEVFSGGTKTDGFGNWAFTIEEPLAGGTYSLSIEARDGRGARSLTEIVEGIKIKPRTIISFGVIELDWFEVFIITVLLIIAGASSFSWYVLKVERKRQAYTAVVGQDVEKLTRLLSTDLENLQSYMTDPYKRNASNAETEIGYLFSKAQTTLADMKKYIGREVDRLS